MHTVENLGRVHPGGAQIFPNIPAEGVKAFRTKLPGKVSLHFL